MGCARSNGGGESRDARESQSKVVEQKRPVERRHSPGADRMEKEGGVRIEQKKK